MRKELLAEFQSLMKVLKQDYTGTWHQVIDRPKSYREFTCTCMIGDAMARGIRGGWAG
jgi:rhamnogalacturonyl hydrolase YesR